MASFVKTREEIPQMFGDQKGDLTFYECETTTVYYEVDPETIARLLPPPLEPWDKPVVMFIYNNIKRSNFSLPYMEPCLAIPCTCKGNFGNWLPALILSDDIGVVVGRELWGYNKKLGLCQCGEKDGVFEGSCTRHGITFASMRADFNREANSQKELQELLGRFKPGQHNFAHRKDWSINYNYMNQYYPWDLVMDGTIEAEPARLVANFKYATPLREPRLGWGEITYQWSEDDPWAELAPKRILGAVSTVNRVNLTGEGRTVAQVPMEDFLPWAYMKLDAHHADQEP